jgi:glycosyltransferase A (GT-A) superfamily protein (DUF2064 family)
LPSQKPLPGYVRPGWERKSAWKNQPASISFKAAFSLGTGAVVVIVTDIPDLKRSIIHAAFGALKENQAVLDPSLDGVYYLVGTRQKCQPFSEG